ncbi:MFS transporter [Streptomyces sp. NPDC052020]|uniref:MFS transporter n=1 Tax=Streptomyces sp. NPDC052020 TaxID=3155677 RepID=UPI003424B29B
MQDVDERASDSALGEQTAGGTLSRPYRRLTIGVVSVVALIAFEATAVATAMPAAARGLHGVDLYAFAFSAYFTTSLAAMVLSGQWCDRRGPLAPLTAGLALFTAGLLLAGAAPAMGVFLLGRATQGLGGGLVIVALYVVVNRAYPERLRPAVMAAFSASWVVPGIVGPLVAGLITQHAGWRWVFLAVPAAMVPALFLALPAVRHTASGPVDGALAEPDPRRVRLAFVVSAGAALLQYAGQRLDPLALLPAAVGAALLLPAVRALMPLGTFRAARGLPAVILLRGVAAGSFIAAESFLPLMLVSRRHMSVTLAGLSLAGGGLTWALGSYLQSRPALQQHRQRLCQAGMVLVAAAIAGAALPLAHGIPAWATALAWCVGGFGMGIVVSSVGVLLMELSEPAEAGGNSAALQLSDSLSNVLLLAVCGVVFAALGGGSAGGGPGQGPIPAGAFLAVFLLLSLVALAGVLVAGRFRTPGSARTPQNAPM